MAGKDGSVLCAAIVSVVGINRADQPADAVSKRFNAS